ncbi:MAG: class I SAM-dependent methyltransferase [Nitrosarchaeum sp.]|nr:MAG: class I SAM-dependent methyltransferase [Nitrosarchaeum sp.]
MNCIACENTLVQFSENSYMELPVYVCKECKLFVTGTSESEVREKANLLYKKEYWNGLKSEESLTSDFTNIDSQGKRRLWISQYAYSKEYMGERKDMLEIGSGAGQTIFYFDQIGFNVTGIEPDERNVKLINQKLKISKCLVGFAEELNMEDQFDIIWISHVFEHLVRPDLLLKKLYKILRPNGIIFIEVPNCENEIIRDSSINDNPSTFHFSKKSLLHISQNAGYNVMCCDYFRAPTLIEGGFNKIKRIISGKNFYPYYPKVIADNKKGTDIRIILKK